MNNILSFNDVSYVINKETIIDHLSFNLPKGSFALILGPNGIGKTTILKIMAGLYKNYTGTVTCLTDRLSYLKQTSAGDEQLFFGTVKEMIQMGSQRHQEKLLNERECLEIIHKIGLDKEQNSLYTQLSGGQQERVKIGMLLASRADLALLDEPTTGLDKEGKLWLNHCLSDLNKKGTTLVIVTHEESVFKDADWSLHCLEQEGAFKYEIWDGEHDNIS